MNARIYVLLPLALAPLLGAAAPAGRLEVSLAGLRNAKGVVQVCLTRDAKRFPDCKADPAAITRSVPAGQASRLAFDALPAGNYGLALFHDENSNARLDTMMKMPREGFAFSRNPKVRFGPPSFRQVVFSVAAEPVKLSVRMQYFL